MGKIMLILNVAYHAVMSYPLGMYLSGIGVVMIAAGLLGGRRSEKGVFEILRDAGIIILAAGAAILVFRLVAEITGFPHFSEEITAAPEAAPGSGGSSRLPFDLPFKLPKL